MGTAAIQVLLDTRPRRRQKSLLLAIIVLIALGIGRMAFLTASPGPGVVLAAVALLAYPGLVAFMSASVLGTLRHGRGLEEALNTMTGPAEWVDSTASACLHDLMRPGALLMLLVAEGVLALQLGVGSFSPVELVLFPVIWLAAMLGLGLMLVYFFLLCAACDERSLDWLDPEVQSWLWLSTLTGMMTFVVMFFDARFALAGLIMTGAGAVGVCRRLAIRGLELSETPRRLQTSPPPRTAPALCVNEAVKPFSGNAIVVREHARLARRIGGGELGWVLHQHGFVLFLGMATMLLLGGRPEWTGLVLLPIYFVIVPIAVASGVSGAMVEEREKRTLESLALTQMTAEEYLDGWAAMGWRPRAVEVLGLAAVSLWLWLYPADGFALGKLLGAYLFVLLYLVAASYLGVLCSLKARSRAQAGSSALVYLLVLGSVFGYAWYLSGPVDWTLLPLAGALLLLLFRRLAMRQVRH